MNDLSKILSGLREKKEERIAKVESIDLDRLLEFYNSAVDFFQNEHRVDKRKDGLWRIRKKFNVTPQAISEFVFAIKEESLSKSKSVYYLDNINFISPLISSLIQHSYEQGHNDFVLPLNEKLEKLCQGIHGTKKNPIRVTIQGDIEGGCGYSAKYTEIRLMGNASDTLGDYSEFCKFTVFGNVGNECGSNSKHSSYALEGDVEKKCGYSSSGCSYDISGDWGPEGGLFSDSCTFKAASLKVLSEIYHNDNTRPELWLKTPEGLEKYSP